MATSAISAAGPPGERVVVREVGPRDGLQSHPRVVPTDSKVAIICTLASAGLRRIECGSYVSPKAVPQMADTAEVLERVGAVADLEVLVVNRRSATQAAAGPSTTLVALLAASDTFAAKNTRSSVADGIEQLADIVAIADDSGKRCIATVSTSFGCAYDGPVAVEAVCRVGAGAVAAGITELTLCDTVGMASPHQVSAVVDAVRREVGDTVTIGLHLHDTRGLALANAAAGLATGVRLFDSSIGGLGGCPYSPGATGNVSTEDLVHLLTLEGYDTGIDIEELLNASKFITDLLDVTNESRVARAGPSWGVGAERVSS